MLQEFGKQKIFPKNGAFSQEEEIALVEENRPVVGILVKPELMRFLSTRKAQYGSVQTQIKEELERRGYKPIFYKELVGIKEESLLALYNETYGKNFLTPLRERIGEVKDPEEKKRLEEIYASHTRFWENGPIALVLAEVPIAWGELSEKEAIAMVRVQRDTFRRMLRFRPGAPRRKVALPSGVLLNKIHTGNVDEVRVLLEPEDIKNISSRRPDIGKRLS